MADDRFKNKVVIVTGGSRGIGEGCVRVFASHGGNVVFCALKANEDEGKRLENELNKARPRSSLFITCDIANEDQVKALIDTTIKTFGRIDSLINNAGWHPPPKFVDEFTSEEFTDLFKINVLGTFMMCKYALPHLRKVQGSIVSIASIAGVLGQDKATTYAATKGAIMSFTKALAYDEAKHGVRVNCVSPSNIRTPLLDEYVSSYKNKEEATSLLTSTQLLNRLGTPEEIGKACFFLAVDATFTTGTNFMASAGAEVGLGTKFVN